MLETRMTIESKRSLPAVCDPVYLIVQCNKRSSNLGVLNPQDLLSMYCLKNSAGK